MASTFGKTAGADNDLTSHCFHIQYRVTATRCLLCTINAVERERRQRLRPISTSIPETQTGCRDRTTRLHGRQKQVVPQEATLPRVLCGGCGAMACYHAARLPFIMSLAILPSLTGLPTDYSRRRIQGTRAMTARKDTQATGAVRSLSTRSATLPPELRGAGDCQVFPHVAGTRGDAKWVQSDLE